MVGVFHIIWNKITELMDNSLFFRFVDGILNFIKALFSGSIFASISTEMKDEDLKQSFFVRRIHDVFGCVTGIRDAFFAEAFENSVLVGLVKNIPCYIMGLTPGDIGLGIGLGIVVVKALGWLPGSAGFLSVSNIILFASILFMFITLYNRDLSIGSMLTGSKFVHIFTRIFSIHLPATKKTSRFGTFFCRLLFFLLVLLFSFLPSPYGLLVIVGVPAALLAAAYPELGIMAVIGTVPFLPTMVLAAMLGYTILCFLLKLLTDRRYSVVIDITGVFLTLYIIITLFLGITSFAQGSSLKIALLTTLFMFSYFLVVTLIRKKEKFDITIFIFSVSAALTGLYGLYQKYSGRIDMTWVDRELFEGLKLRVFSTFGNPNVYGAYLLLAIPVCFCMAFYVRHWLMKLYYLGVSLLLLLNLALTYSRGCYVALAVAVVVFVLFMEKRLITFLSVGIFALPVLLPPSIINRLASITNFSDSSTSYRISIWQATLRIIRDYWFVGLGQGIDAYNKVYPLYRFNSVSAPHSHNLYLQIIVETGIIGLGIFIALLFCFYKTQIPFLNQSKNFGAKAISAAFMAAVIGFLLQGIFDYVFYNNRLHLTFFIVLGLANAFVHIIRKGDTE